MRADCPRGGATLCFAGLNSLVSSAANTRALLSLIRKEIIERRALAETSVPPATWCSIETMLGRWRTYRNQTAATGHGGINGQGQGWWTNE